MLLAFLDKPEIATTSSRIGACFDLGPAVLDLLPDGNRWCLLPGRGLNPFFCLQEIFWVLSGSNALAGLNYYIEDYARYSDDGKTLTGAYGHRLRSYFGFDQLERAVAELRATPDSRRVCLTTWSSDDLGRQSNDIPCNITIALKIRHGRLDLSIFNRSNDVYRGVPYDVLVFGALQASLAAALNLPTGRQVHFIDSLHLYEADVLPAQEAVRNSLMTKRLINQVPPSPLSSLTGLDHTRLATEFSTPVAGPEEYLQVRNAYFPWRAGHRHDALSMLPETELGLCAAFWFMKRAGFENADLPFWVQRLLILER